MLQATAAIHANPTRVLQARGWRPAYGGPGQASSARLLPTGAPRKERLRLRGGCEDEAEELQDEEETQVSGQGLSNDWLDEYLPEDVRKDWCAAHRLQPAEAGGCTWDT